MLTIRYLHSKEAREAHYLATGQTLFCGATREVGPDAPRWAELAKGREAPWEEAIVVGWHDLPAPTFAANVADDVLVDALLTWRATVAAYHVDREARDAARVEEARLERAREAAAWLEAPHVRVTDMDPSDVRRALEGAPHVLSDLRAAYVDAARERAQRDYLEEATAWILAHGSARLRAILEHGYLADSHAVYREERLAVDRPGWQWDDDDGKNLEPRNPTLEALRLLEKARVLEPSAQLVRLRWERDREEYGDGDMYVWAWACTSQFLGRAIRIVLEEAS